MHFETVTFERVFDIQQRESSRGSPGMTDFSFEFAGIKHYAVSAPGWPSITQGDTVTVVLGEAGNWQTLAGWKNHTTGELALPATGDSIAGAVISAGMVLASSTWFSNASTSLGRWSSGALVVFCVLLTVSLIAQWRRQRAQSLAIKRANQSLEPTRVGKPPLAAQLQR